MTLGSPNSSPSPAGGMNTYLPSYLMGETTVPSMPRSNTLSPNMGRGLVFPQSPTGIPASPEFNRANITQHKSFLGYQQSPAHQNAFSSPAAAAVNKSISGPPTQSLFDSLHAEKLNIQQTPTRIGQTNLQNYGTPSAANQSNIYNQSLNESYFNQSGFMSPTPQSRITSPLSTQDGKQHQLHHHSILNSTQLNSVTNTPIACPLPSNSFWITVYGFPPTATSMIISHFSQCGTIVDKMLPPQNGNWIHLKYLSRLECDKAMNYNEKVLNNNLMIGVSRCKDPNVADKENIDNEIVFNRIRPLTHAGYKSAQHPTEVVPGLSTPKKTTGLVNKAMDLFFGW